MMDGSIKKSKKNQGEIASTNRSEDRTEDYRKVYRMLEDDESRDIYLNRLNWEISGDPKYLAAIVSGYVHMDSFFISEVNP